MSDDHDVAGRQVTGIGIAPDIVLEHAVRNALAAGFDFEPSVGQSPDSGLGRYACDFAIFAYAAPDYLERAGKRALIDCDWIVFQPTMQ